MSVGARPLGHIEQNVVRIALVHDKQGKALVLVPAHALLNLASLWRLTGRQLQPVSCGDSQRFFTQDGLKTPWGQQQLMEMPLIIDSAIDQKQRVELWEPYTGLRFKVREGWLQKAVNTGLWVLLLNLFVSIRLNKVTRKRSLERWNIFQHCVSVNDWKTLSACLVSVKPRKS